MMRDEIKEKNQSKKIYKKTKNNKKMRIKLDTKSK
jgi:hypothetical protein